MFFQTYGIELLSNRISRTFESGIYHHWLSQSKSAKRNKVTNYIDNYAWTELAFKKLSGVFDVGMVGLVIAIGVALSEIMTCLKYYLCN